MNRIPFYLFVGKRFYDPNAPPVLSIVLELMIDKYKEVFMYESYLTQLEEAGKIRNLKERSISCYKNYVSYFLNYTKKDPAELSCQDVRAFLLERKDAGIKAATL